MEKKNSNQERKKERRPAPIQQDLGVDQDEQAMNGEYGMLETEEEDRLHDKE
ncbi:Protein of unknown function [Halobacillus karajensis]|uniref:DUF4021 domain-containing protein n=1 Tax=Halobacillus karajensis TaxID=195088 RepID=A0A024P2A6_9BACI|nr:DUF4021 domain-containing protein [Halobacillus karajensis]CDQ19949.1 hypothetical protein BN982_02256 [Halobacillus karajensis]CDQ22409.1 hypothetical protein BN983_00617 [Halobacillus karajensis]CDQ28252.1 hypothetical protein BN981_02546 [Halobacillus karajensis]SEH69343.1 Protein of unknown function [Halobacillus karajensis]